MQIDPRDHVHTDQSRGYLIFLLDQFISVSWNDINSFDCVSDQKYFKGKYLDYEVRSRSKGSLYP